MRQKNSLTFNLKKEISVVISRFSNDQIYAYEPIENIHENQILKHSKIPADITEEISNKAKNNAKTVTSYLIGVDPAYQNKGITAIIFSDFTTSFNAIGVKNVIRTPELEDNTAIHQLWKNFDPKTHKKRRTYRKNI